MSPLKTTIGAVSIALLLLVVLQQGEAGQSGRDLARGQGLPCWGMTWRGILKRAMETSNGLDHGFFDTAHGDKAGGKIYEASQQPGTGFPRTISIVYAGRRWDGDFERLLKIIGDICRKSSPMEEEKEVIAVAAAPKIKTSGGGNAVEDEEEQEDTVLGKKLIWSRASSDARAFIAFARKWQKAVCFYETEPAASDKNAAHIASS